MMAAVQPFISGAISKTVNVPEDATVEDIKRAYILGWELGLKAVAIYRDGSKRSQPLSTKAHTMDQEPAVAELKLSDAIERVKEYLNQCSATERQEFASLLGVVSKASRRKLPDERPSVTKKFNVGGHEGYIHVGLYPDGTPGEIFVTMSKEGSTIGGLMDAFATAVSIGLQYGAPLEDLVRKFRNMRFEPSGFCPGDELVHTATSPVDYVARYLEEKFLKEAPPTGGTVFESNHFGTVVVKHEVVSHNISGGDSSSKEPFIAETVSDAPPCSNCGTLTVRAGSCHTCPSCGTTTGCG